MNDFSLLFLGTSSFALEGLKTLNQVPEFKVKGVITTPDSIQKRGLKKVSSVVKKWSEKQNVPVWAPESLESSDFIKQISKSKFDVAVVISYGKILPDSFLKLFPRIVNIHPSLLPRWRGAAPIERALLAGDKKTGVCLQVVSKKLDAGDIIKSYSFPIHKNDSAIEVYEQAKEFSNKILKEDLLKYMQGELRATPQETEGVTYAHKIQKKEGLINWSSSNEDIHNQIRGLNKGPHAFTFFQNMRLKIHRSEIPSQEFPSASEGEMLFNKGEWIVSCGRGFLKILEVQRESRNKRSAFEFLKGHSVQAGKKFKNAL